MADLLPILRIQVSLTKDTNEEKKKNEIFNSMRSKHKLTCDKRAFYLHVAFAFNIANHFCGHSQLLRWIIAFAVLFIQLEVFSLSLGTKYQSFT